MPWTNICAGSLQTRHRPSKQADIHENSCPSAQLQRPPVFLCQLDKGVGGIGQIAAALAADGDIPDGMGWHGEEGHIFEGAAVGTGGLDADFEVSATDDYSDNNTEF